MEDNLKLQKVLGSGRFIKFTVYKVLNMDIVLTQMYHFTF